VSPTPPAKKEKIITPTVDVKIWLDGIILNVKIIGYNPNEIEALYVGGTIEQNLDDSNIDTGKWHFPEGKPIKPLSEFVVYQTHRDIIYSAEIVEKAFRGEPIEVKVRGSVLMEVGASSFDIPFEKVAKLSIEIDEEKVKLARCPTISRIGLEVNQIVNPKGEIIAIRPELIVTINNPNPAKILWLSFDYNIYLYKDEKWIRLFGGTWGATAEYIEPMMPESRRLTGEEITDKEIIQYLQKKEKVNAKVKGSMFLILKDYGPTYFKPSYEAFITIENGSGVTEEVKQYLPRKIVQKERLMQKSPERYKWYHNDEFGYKIGYPENWTIVPKEEIVLGEGIEHAQFFTEPDTPSTILVSIRSEYDIEGLKAIGGKDVVINGREGYEVIIQPIPGVKQKIVAFVVNDKYYLITCSTSANLFDEYTATFDNVINLFVIE